MPFEPLPNVLVYNLFRKHFHRCQACKIFLLLQQHKTTFPSWCWMIWNKATQGEAKIVTITLIRSTVCPDKQLVKSLIWERCFNLYLLTGCKGYIAFWLLKCSIEKLKVDLDMLCVFERVCQMLVHVSYWYVNVFAIPKSTSFMWGNNSLRRTWLYLFIFKYRFYWNNAPIVFALYRVSNYTRGQVRRMNG